MSTAPVDIRTARAGSLRADASGSVTAEQTTLPDGSPNQTPGQGNSEAKAAPESAKVAEAAAPPRRGLRKLALSTVGLLALAVGAHFAYDYITVGQYIVSTDDAYVGADMALIAPKIAAHVAEVAITENQAVKQGDLLVRLDSGDYQLAVDQANAKLATQQAAITTFDAQIRAGEATLNQARAQLDSAKANAAKAEADYTRTKPLADRDYTSKATLDATVAARDSARAQVQANEAAIETATANVALLRAQRQQAEKVARELQVAVDQANRELAFTEIRAPLNGVVGNKSVQVGDYLTPGKRIAAIVPLDQIYVDANLKETQLPGVQPGETATVSVDALGGQALKGTVVSVAPASGSQFSLLPPENATGNFTKIVQRVPVRIAIPASEAQNRLRPGLSVVVGIDTRTAPEANATQRAADAAMETH